MGIKQNGVTVFYGRYRVYPNGYVYSKRNFRRLKTSIRGEYASVSLYCNGKRKSLPLHRLIAETFISNPEKLPCVNHKDGNKLNNSVENLEWVSYQENNAHATRIGLWNHKKEGHTLAKLTEQNVEVIRDLLLMGHTQISIAIQFGVCQQTISAIKCGKRWGPI